MAHDVLLRKLTYLRQLLADLAPYEHASWQNIQSDHYKLERILELLVMVASDILFHLLAEQNVTATTYRGAFQEAAKQGWLPDELAQRLQQAAGMRNVIVHMYETVDYRILQDAIAPALADFKQFLNIFESRFSPEEE